MNRSLLSIDNLAVHFETPDGPARAVDNISLNIHAGETLGLVGESGCGKSLTALSILRLLPAAARMSAGEITFKNDNLADFTDAGMRHIRGREIAMIFQEPMTSLNPVMPIGFQVAEPLITHQKLPKADAYSQAAEWLEYVRIPAAGKRLNDYPHQLSGGMRQRVMIAMAMVCRPLLLIADEPTTALDVTIQAQILALMRRLKETQQMALLLISHDLSIIAQMANRVAVMYAGQVVEISPVKQLFDRPLHPYTQGLLRSIPLPGTVEKRLFEISGTVPRLTDMIRGCKFSERCIQAQKRCYDEKPELLNIGDGRKVRCWLGQN
ncbi:ABC transporter ATP-binding protein [Desulfococcaceae bacterium HSG9]|nr:ABC transporter ATP-binding protein [Desulfococcaceae bacterium HSG9]